MAGVPSKRALLREIDPLTHAARTKRVALLGRDHAGEPALEVLLRELDANVYEWRLRVTAACAARSVAHLLAAIARPERSVRAMAIARLRLFPLDASWLGEMLESVSTADRRTLTDALRRSRDPHAPVAADALIGMVHERFGDDESAALLPACSEQALRVWLPRLAHASVHWTTLAARRAGAFREFADAVLADSDDGDFSWWHRLEPAIARLGVREPLTVLDLWERHAPDTGIPHCFGARLTRLVRVAPERTLDLLLRPRMRPYPWRFIDRLRPALHGIDDQRLGRLAATLVADDEHGELATMLDVLPPGRRDAVFRLAHAGRDTTTLALPDALFEALPHAARAREARRELALARNREDERSRHTLMVSLPIAETWDELRAATHASDAARRAEAYGRLVRAVLRARDPAWLERLLDELGRLANEQDPVRGAALEALAACPSRSIGEEHLPALGGLVRHVVEARDTSYATVDAFARLLRAVVASAATPERRALLAPAIDALVRLSEKFGRLHLGNLRHSLPAGGEHVLFGALERRLTDDRQAGRHELLFALSHGLDRRARAVPGLQALLRDVAFGRDVAAARHAIPLWLADPAERHVRVGELVSDDPSATLLPVVLELVSRIRQDLLDVVLGRRPPRGRFATTKTRPVALIRQGVPCWTPRQWRAYGGLLREAALNEHTGYLRAAAVETLCRLPDEQASDVTPFLASDDISLQEAALGGLPWRQRPGRALPLLLSHADGDRARVAMYAASRAARFAPPADVDDAMRVVLRDPSSRLTSRKEALRILADNRTPAALATFADAWTRRPLHRDLAIALASSLRRYPDAPLVAEVFETMSTASGDEALAIARMLREPRDWPEARRPWVGRTAATLAGHDDPDVRREAWSSLWRSRPWFDGVDALVRDTVSELAPDARWREGVNALHRLLPDAGARDLLVDTVTTLLHRPEPPDARAGLERDSPIAQRLAVLSERCPRTRAGREALRAVVPVLLAHDRSVAASRFLLASIDWLAPHDALTALADLAETHADARPALLERVRGSLEQPDGAGQVEGVALLESARAVVERGEGGALVAFALTRFAGPRSGWSAEWRALLLALREHPSPWVALPARELYTAPE